jgi:hypothetical protein
MVMALGETYSITKKGISMWFHEKNMFLRTLPKYIEFVKHILFVKPLSDTILRITCVLNTPY